MSRSWALLAILATLQISEGRLICFNLPHFWGCGCGGPIPVPPFNPFPTPGGLFARSAEAGDTPILQQEPLQDPYLYGGDDTILASDESEQLRAIHIPHRIPRKHFPYPSYVWPRPRLDLYSQNENQNEISLDREDEMGKTFWHHQRPYDFRYRDDLQTGPREYFEHRHRRPYGERGYRRTLPFFHDYHRQPSYRLLEEGNSERAETLEDGGSKSLEKRNASEYEQVANEKNSDSIGDDGNAEDTARRGSDDAYNEFLKTLYGTDEGPDEVHLNLNAEPENKEDFELGERNDDLLSENGDLKSDAECDEKAAPLEEEPVAPRCHVTRPEFEIDYNSWRKPCGGYRPWSPYQGYGSEFWQGRWDEYSERPWEGRFGCNPWRGFEEYDQDPYWSGDVDRLEPYFPEEHHHGWSNGPWDLPSKLVIPPCAKRPCNGAPGFCLHHSRASKLHSRRHTSHGHSTVTTDQCHNSKLTCSCLPHKH